MPSIAKGKRSEGLTSLRWPVLRFKKLFHVGTMDPECKGSTHNKCSLEGSGLSVSIHPREWTRIARLGGQPTWELSPSAGNDQLLDIHKLKKIQKEEILRWGESEGLIESKPLLKLSYYDSELDDIVFTLFDASDAQAVENAQGEMDERVDNEDESARLETIHDWMATQKLNDLIGFKISIGQGFDMVATIFVEDVLSGSHGIQGVWWNEKLDPWALSAPRGVIHKQALNGWAKLNLDEVQSQDARQRQGPSGN